MIFRLCLFLVAFSLNSNAQVFHYVEMDTIVNVDLWTHVSRKQLPKYITQEEKDSLYTAQLKKTGEEEITVYLLYVGEAIDEQKIPCKFKKRKIILEPIIEYRGEVFFWGRASLKRKIEFNNLTQLEYFSKTKSLDFKYFIWPAKITKQEIHKSYYKINLYGL